MLMPPAFCRVQALRVRNANLPSALWLLPYTCMCVLLISKPISLNVQFNEVSLLHQTRLSCWFSQNS